MRVLELFHCWTPSSEASRVGPRVKVRPPPSQVGPPPPPFDPRQVLRPLPPPLLLLLRPALASVFSSTSMVGRVRSFMYDLISHPPPPMHASSTRPVSQIGMSRVRFSVVSIMVLITDYRRGCFRISGINPTATRP